MSGELTLRGKVLPVGGIKEKLLAAHREGLREAILPLENMCDLKDMPKKIMSAMKIHFVETMDEVLKVALTKEIPTGDKKQIAVQTELTKDKSKGEDSQEPPVRH